MIKQFLVCYAPKHRYMGQFSHIVIIVSAESARGAIKYVMTREDVPQPKDFYYAKPTALKLEFAKVYKL